MIVFYLDQDHDGFGSLTETQESCQLPEGYVERSGDCIDLETMIHPNNYGRLCDGIDNNCDGTIDIDAEDRFLIFTDEDEDGFGDENAVGTLNCELLDGFSLNNDDCDDGNGAISPDADDL